MEPRQLVNLMGTFEKLKNATRHSWTSAGRRESVAEHSWRLALLSYFVKDEFPRVDFNRVILMALVHDIGEAFTGDIPAFLKTTAHEAEEDKAVEGFLASLPQPYHDELTSLVAEMNAQESPEAKVYKALDRLEAVLQHNEADISTWLPLEYTLQLSYGAAETEFSEYMLRLKKTLNSDSIDKINREKGAGDDRNQVL